MKSIKDAAAKQKWRSDMSRYSNSYLAIILSTHHVIEFRMSCIYYRDKGCFMLDMLEYGDNHSTMFHLHGVVYRVAEKTQNMGGSFVD